MYRLVIPYIPRIPRQNYIRLENAAVLAAIIFYEKWLINEKVAKTPKRLQKVRDGEGKMTECLVIMYHQTVVVV